MDPAAQDALGAERPVLEPAPSALSRTELRSLYLAYRKRQARALLGMMPRQAIRPLYRRCAGKAAGRIHDPMETLVSCCEELLPLPPFEVWLEDFAAAPEAHWNDLEGSPGAPSAAEPATVEALRFRRGGETWTARLRASRDEDGWRGLIVFEEDEGSLDVYRTTHVFREPTLGDLRDRFRSFDSGSLEAFLRSTLP